MNPSKVFKTLLSYILLVIALVVYAIEIVPFYAEMSRGPDSLGYMIGIIIFVVAFIVMSLKPKKNIAHKVEVHKIIAPLAIMGIIAYTELSSSTYMNLVNDLRSSINSYIYSYIYPYYQQYFILVVILLVALIKFMTLSAPSNKTKNYESNVNENKNLDNTFKVDHSSSEHGACRFCGSHKHSSLEHENCRFCGSHEHSSLEHRRR
ncbi:MAG: hypothetical protein NTV30_00850 [Chloroflexi bacterium]|nr:hypothetical protein [Chloroflexota bacterium]